MDGETPVIGLLGGIGCGKSRVADALREMGASVVDADRLCHEALEADEVRTRVVDRWGAGVCAPDGRVDRKALARRVFADRDELTALTEILWTAIRPETLRRIEAGRQDAHTRAVVLDAALLLEAGWGELCDRLVFVSSPESVRLERVDAQRGWRKEELLARERMQMPLADKQAAADVVVDNAGSWDRCRAQLQRLMNEMTGG